MPKLSEIVDRAFFRRCGIDIEPLRVWWRRPVHSDHTIEALLKDSFEDHLLGDGIWQCIQNLDRTGAGQRVSAEWLKAASAAVQEDPTVDMDGVPIWLSSLRESVRAIRFWHCCAAEYPIQCNSEVLLGGMEFVRSGFPALALSYWRRIRRAARHQARRERILQKRASMIVHEAERFAQAVGVSPPSSSGLDADATLEAVVRWCDELRECTILDHFWRDHLEYLLRIKETDPQLDVLPLILTAQKRTPATLTTLRKLVLVNRHHADRLLRGMPLFA